MEKDGMTEIVVQNTGNGEPSFKHFFESNLAKPHHRKKFAISSRSFIKSKGSFLFALKLKASYTG